MTTKESHERQDYYTFTFKVDPNLNGGYDTAFNQGGEPWWWVVDSNGSRPAAGSVNLKGATLVSVHNWGDVIWSKQDEQS